MTSENYRRILNNEFKDKEMTPDDFDNTLMHFAMLYHKEQLLLHSVSSSNDFLKTLVCKNGDTWHLPDDQIELWESNGDIKKGDKLYNTILIKQY